MDEPSATDRDVERTLRHALEIVSDGIWDWDMRSGHVTRSPGWYAMLGFPRNSLPEDVDTWENIIHPDDLPRVMQSFNAYLEGRSEVYEEEYRCRCQDGRYLWISDHGRFVEFDEDGQPTRMIGAHRDVHQRKLAELELQQRNQELLRINGDLEALVASRTEALAQANRALAEQVEAAIRLSETDPLTGIANRRCFETRLQREWQRFQRHHCPTGLVMLDLDHFKRINDEHGHAEGDRILQAVAEQIRAALREEDCFARWGGEEFILLLPDTGPEALLQLARRLHRRIPEAGTDLPQRLSASFAVASLVAGEDITALLKRLDDGLYRAKQQRDCVIVCPSP